MKTIEVPIPEIGLIAATRAMLGAGIGLLFARRLTENRRIAVGKALFAIGALSTIPLMCDLLSRRRSK